MPNCHTTFEELVYTFGGPWLFGLVLLGLPVLLALVLSIARMRYIGGDDLPALDPTPHDTRIHSFPFLESLNEVHCQFYVFFSSTFHYSPIWDSLHFQITF